MGFKGGHKCQNLKLVKGSHQYSIAIELQIVLLCLNLNQECSLSDIREVLIAYKLFDSSSFYLIACSHPCSIKAPSLNTVSNVTNLVAGLIYFLSHAFHRRMKGAVNKTFWSFFLFYFHFCVAAGFSWGRQIKDRQIFKVKFILAIHVAQ